MAAEDHRLGTHDEAELLRRVAARDHAAFHQLYLEYFGRLGRFLTRVTRQPEVIEEVINDTMLAVWNQAGQFRGDSRPSTWIFGIAYRVALKALRRDASMPADSSMPADVFDTGVADGQLMCAEIDDWLQQGLGQLSAEHRMAIELAYYMGMSCEEIAAITSCPVGTVKTRIFHARLHLRRILNLLAGPTELGRNTGAMQ
jgi:RNA polymerase sigma-70 factor (ECF subfamily)